MPVGGKVQLRKDHLAAPGEVHTRRDRREGDRDVRGDGQLVGMAAGQRREALLQRAHGGEDVLEPYVVRRAFGGPRIDVRIQVAARPPRDRTERRAAQVGLPLEDRELLAPGGQVFLRMVQAGLPEAVRQVSPSAPSSRPSCFSRYSMYIGRRASARVPRSASTMSFRRASGRMMSVSLRSSSPMAARASGMVFSRSHRKPTSSRRQARRVARSCSSAEDSCSSLARSVTRSAYRGAATRPMGTWPGAAGACRGRYYNLPVGTDTLVIHGAREHNLKNVTLELPRNQLIVFTGLSGSGKSSLAFDTIYAEGQRRYVESLSAYARQFLGQMEKPDVDFIEGLSPAISIDQKSTSKNPRSTVGTITEIYDYLRVLYARIGHPHCPKCGRPIGRQTPEQIVDRILELPAGTRFQLLAPVVRGRKGEYEALLRSYSSKGFARARVDGEIRDLSEPIRLAKTYKHDIEIVVDRLVAKGPDADEKSRRRLADSVETAVGLAEGLVLIDLVDEKRELQFSTHLACLYDNLSFEDPAPRNFSFNAPYGACPDCTGLGVKREVDPELVVPNPSLSLGEGAVAPFQWGRGASDYFDRLLAAVAEGYGFTLSTPWSELTDEQRKVVLFGAGEPVYVRYKNRYGRQRAYHTAYEGVVPYLNRRYSEAESDSVRERVESYMREVPCPTCHGARLRPESLAVTVADRNIAQVAALSVGETARFFATLELSDRDRYIAARVLKEINARLGFLLDVGLDYLTLDRASATLAGGEAQRIRLATQIGSGLTGVLYVLDEPSIGLHQRDNHRLIETLLRLRDLGNTLIVVEHDEATIRTADYLVDIGPGAGEHGGEIVAPGSLAD